MVAILALSISTGTPLISSPSIVMVPSTHSIIRRRLNNKVDFPLPVLPQIPTWAAIYYNIHRDLAGYRNKN
jgi:hypothetical protein